MSSPAAGLLFVWTDIDPAEEVAFNDWYTREHMPERITGVPGFRRGRRFVAVSGGPKYLALYDTASAETMRSAPYLELNRRSDPTSRHFVPLFRNVIKGIHDVVARSSDAAGGAIAVLPVQAASGREAEFGGWLGDVLLPEIVRGPGVVSAFCSARNDAVTRSAIGVYLRQGDRWADMLLVIEGLDVDAVAGTIALIAPERLSAHGGIATMVPAPVLFRPLYTLQALVPSPIP